jgi:hypothetical protein
MLNIGVLSKIWCILRDIANAIGAGEEGLTAYTPSVLTDAGAGTVAAGAISFSIANVGVAAGTVDGDSLPIGGVASFSAPSGGDLTAMSYDATGTTFLISEVRP